MSWRKWCVSRRGWPQRIGSRGESLAFRPCLARPARNRHFSWPTFRRHLDNLVKVTTILPNRDDLAAAREGRGKVLGDRKPASTLIVGSLANPAWKIEIEGIAVA
jgi:hypothetical protein